MTSQTAPDINTAIIVDDIAADRQLAARPLQRAGWAVHTARNSVEGFALVNTVLSPATAARAVVLTDLNMPADLVYGSTNHHTVAGSQFALQIRASMGRGLLPRAPIIALTALTESEACMTALAFGCDAVLTKPATPDLPARIQAALSQARLEEAETPGADALLQLLRYRLAESITLPAARRPALTEQDVTKALLAYHRHGLSGLARSALAAFLAPNLTAPAQRGERAYQLLLQALSEIMGLCVEESASILRGELVHQLAPAEQRGVLGLSLSEYYRRRREAVAALFDLLAGEHSQIEYTQHG